MKKKEKENWKLYRRNGIFFLSSLSMTFGKALIQLFIAQKHSVE